MIQITEHGVVLEQVRKRFGVSQVVDGDEIDVWITKCSAKNVSPDTTEPIDTNLNRHCKSPPTSIEFCLDCGKSAVAIVGQIFPTHPCKLLVKNERQDYAEGFGVSSEAFIQLIQLFETAFPHGT
jgi:hypothetical protein